MSKKEIKIFTASGWGDYELLDTGEGEKLERFGPYTFVRPYEDAVWKKTLGSKVWQNIQGRFASSKKGEKPGWKLSKGTFDRPKWQMTYKDVKFWANPTPFRHLAFFPEQASHWDFISRTIKQRTMEGHKVKFLNLFGYTGVASLMALSAGAEVTHVDASKQILKNVQENVELSGLSGLPIRIIPEDAIKFLEREAKRGNSYDAIIMDPPKFGRGPKGEIWKIEEQLSDLLAKAQKVLSKDALFMILTSYAIDSSSLSLGHALEDATKTRGGTIEQGELCILEKSNNREISLANTAIWVKN